jgi:hypothetical protein
MKTRRLTVAEKHQKRIALDTLKMSDAMVAVTGGMTKTEAVEFLTSLGERVQNPKPTRQNIS